MMTALYGDDERAQEMNDGDATTRFLQIWLTPDKRGVAPQYGSKSFQHGDRHNRLLHLLAGHTPPPQWAGVNPLAPDTHLHQVCAALPVLSLLWQIEPKGIFICAAL